MANNNWVNMMYNLGLMGGKWLGQSAQDRAVSQMDKLTADQMIQNIGNMGNFDVNRALRKDGGLYQSLANQALQNTPQNAGNIDTVTPNVQTNTPNVTGNQYAIPTPSQAVAGNGYNFSAPSIKDIVNNLSNYGGYSGNFQMGRRY